MSDPRRSLADNPFYVLGLAPDCSRVEVEREGNKLLGMLQLGLSASRTYRSPLGTHERTAEEVRAAMAELRDPERRLVHELWAQLPADELPGPASDAADAETGEPRAPDDVRNSDTATWDGALAALGWRRG